MTRIDLRPYNPNLDEAALLPLWQAALGDAWPMRDDLLRRQLTDHRFYRADDHFVALAGERIVGFAGTQVDRSEHAGHNPNGGVSVVIVHPDWQRQGIGTRLHDAALAHLRQVGVASLRLGGGGAYRFWPGVPTDLPGGLDFFTARGWEFDLDRRSSDLVRDLSDFQVPAAMSARLAQEGVTVQSARKDEVDDVLAFEFQHFSGWAPGFVYTAALGDYQNLLVARDPHKGIVGTLMLHTPTARWLAANVTWKTTLGDSLGGISAVGVAESERGRGIGIGMVAVGSEVLRERGVGNCHIDWTGIVDFYGKLGYTVWRQYWMSTRDLT
jgi:beta-N-acetylhexosaminidase